MIDPVTLESQRAAAARPEAQPCTRCGRRTRDKTGICRRCHVEIPDMRLWDMGRLAAVISAAQAELTRRRDEIDRVLAGEVRS